MQISKQQQQFSRNVAKLIEYIYSQGYSCTFGEAYRTPEQAELNAKKGIGIKNSLHTQRMAIDLNLFDELGHYCTDVGPYEKFGVYWESLHPLNRNGRNWHLKDANHFEQQLAK